MIPVVLSITLSTAVIFPPNPCLMGRAKTISSGATKQAFGAPLVIWGASAAAGGVGYMAFMLAKDVGGSKAIPGSMIAVGVVVVVVGGILLSQGRGDIVSAEQLVCPVESLD